MMQFLFLMKNNLIRINKIEDLELVNPEPFPLKDGFFYFPLNRLLALNKDGLIINTKTLNIRKPYYNSDNGKLSIIITNDKHFFSYYLHRVIAITFIGKPSRHKNKNFKDLEVNHINGNVLDNNISNLEWVTSEENVLHSHLSGFNPKDIPVEAFNFITKEIKYFNSLKACSDYFSIHRATFYKALVKKVRDFKCKNYIFRCYSEKEWKIPNINFDTLPEIGCNRNLYLNIYIKDKITKKIYIFDSIRKVSEFTKISNTTLWRYLTKNKILDNEKYFITSDPNVMR